MFSVNILRRFRPCFVSQSFSKANIPAAGRVALFSVCCFSGRSGKRLDVVRRSLLYKGVKVCSCPPSSRSLSTAAPSDQGNLVYTGNLGTTIRIVKAFSYSTSTAGLALLYLIFKNGVGTQSLVMDIAFCGMISLFTISTPILLHLVTKGYVFRLYHNPDSDTYTAFTCSVFLTEKKTVFQQKNVRIPAIRKIFTSFYANNTGLLVNPDLFPTPHDYNHLMGYDKPFSFSKDDLETP
ncbi:transmembrane protein 70, mitochondrial [Aulostomus maculatus]